MTRFETEQQLAEFVAGSNGPLHIRGGGTRAVGNPVTGEVLDVSGLSGITLYEPGALTLVAQAGTPLAEVEAALDAQGQRLAFEPMDHRPLLGTTGTPTIGGVVAANVSGPRRISVGACRDFMLGVRFVDGAGQIVKNGGRVMKNVTGYDLVKLLTGSHGTLGVITEVSLKVLPKPAFTGVLLINGLTDADAVNAMSTAMKSPYEVSGAAHTPSGLDDHPVTMLRLEGFEASVRYRADALTKLLSGFGDIVLETDPDKTASGWAWVRDAIPMTQSDGDVWRVSVKPSDAPELVARAAPLASLYDWAGGLVWMSVPQGTDLRKRLGDFQGHATLIRASDATRRTLPVFHPQPAALETLSAGLRRKFDPLGRLNPGIMAA